jgi:thioredoxin 1
MNTNPTTETKDVILHLDEKSFVSEIENYKGLAVVDFYADWCGPCRAMSPIFEELAKEQTQVKFAKIDVDAIGSVAEKFGVMSIPTLIVFKDGQPLKTKTGLQQKKDILELLDIKV